MLEKKCKGYKLPNGKRNPNCEEEFFVRPNHFSRRDLCPSCQRLRDNKYHAKYLREWRKKQKAK